MFYGQTDIDLWNSLNGGHGEKSGGEEFDGKSVGEKSGGEKFGGKFISERIEKK
jgi:hypothetical protein